VTTEEERKAHKKAKKDRKIKKALKAAKKMEAAANMDTKEDVDNSHFLSLLDLSWDDLLFPKVMNIHWKC